MEVDTMSGLWNEIPVGFVARSREQEVLERSNLVVWKQAVPIAGRKVVFTSHNEDGACEVRSGFESQREEEFSEALWLLEPFG
jgi:hypothetical protein